MPRGGFSLAGRGDLRAVRKDKCSAVLEQNLLEATEGCKVG